MGVDISHLPLLLRLLFLITQMLHTLIKQKHVLLRVFLSLVAPISMTHPKMRSQIL